MNQQPLTDIEYQNLILADCNDNGVVATNMNKIWRLYSSWSIYNSLDGRWTLQYLKARAHALLLCMADVRWQVTTTARDRRYELKDLFEYLKSMYDITTAEIAVSMQFYIGSPTPAVDQFDATLPNLDAIPGLPDPNDTIYTGDPRKSWFPWTTW